MAYFFLTHCNDGLYHMYAFVWHWMADAVLKYSTVGLHSFCEVIQSSDAGLNLLKLALVWVAIGMAVYRCQQECAPSTFLSMEQHLYRVQWYLRLFAASAVMYGTVLAALQGSKSSAAAEEATPLSSSAPSSRADSAPASFSAADSAAGGAPASGSAATGTAGGAPEEMHAGRTQSVNRPQVKVLWPDAVCEAVCLPERMASIFGDWGHGLLRFAVSPIVLVLLCAWWLPQHPAFRWSTYKRVLDA